MRTLEEFRALIQKGLGDDPRYTVDEVIEGLHTGEFHYFSDDEGVVITKFTGNRDKRLLVFLLAGENFNGWKESMNARLKAFAKKEGCSRIEAYCRRGLQKPLETLGWQVQQVVMTTRIE